MHLAGALSTGNEKPEVGLRFLESSVFLWLLPALTLSGFFVGRLVQLKQNQLYSSRPLYSNRLLVACFEKLPLYGNVDYLLYSRRRLTRKFRHHSGFAGWVLD